MKIKSVKIASFIMSAIIVVLNTGCSAFRPNFQIINVISDPEDASLMINGQKYSSPAQVSVKRNEPVSIQARKEGYSTAQRVVGTHFNETGILDAVGTLVFLCPGIGLFTPGAYSLDETSVYMNLEEK